MSVEHFYDNDTFYISELHVNILIANTIVGSITNTDANGISTTSDGPFGVNPINKTESNQTNAYYFRDENGLTLINGSHPPGGLTNVAPLGVVNNSPNSTEIVRQITTIDTATAIVASFPSNGVNRQAYTLTAICFGCSATGDVIGLEAKATFNYSTSGATPRRTLERTGNLVGGDVTLVQAGNFYNLIVTGVFGYTLTWNCTIKYTQYRYA